MKEKTYILQKMPLLQLLPLLPRLPHLPLPQLSPNGY
jgi:hypothetical protein